MLLRYLKKAEIKKAVQEKQSNGTYLDLDKYTSIKEYSVQAQELNDEISASIYGASIVNMLRIKTPLGDLENYLKGKMNDTDDNISQYFIFIDNKKYKILSVTKRGVDLELI